MRLAGALVRLFLVSDALEPLNHALTKPGRETDPRGARANHHLSDSRSTPLSLAANFRWALTGNVVYALCQWAMLSVLARWGTPVAVGQFVLGLAIASPIMALAMLQLRNVQITDVHQTFSFSDYFAARIVWTLVGLGAILVWGTLASEDSTMFWVIVLVGLMKSVDSVSDIVRGLFQYRERMDLNGISMMTKGVLSLLALAISMKLTGSVVVATAAAAVSWFVAFVAYDLVIARRLLSSKAVAPNAGSGFRPRFRLQAMARLTWIALPLGAVMAIISLQTNIPRYVLESYSGSKLLGYFGAIVYPMMAGMMVTTAMGQSASPKLAKYFVEDLTAFVRLLGRMSGISAVLALALIAGTHFLGDRVLWFLYGPEYATYHREFEVLAVAWGIQLVSSCWGYGLTAARCFRVQVVLTVVSCVATLLASIILVPRYGVMGAALAVLVTSLSMTVGFSLVMFWVVRAARAQKLALALSENPYLS